MDSVFFVLEIIGTIAFSVSGALVAIEKKMDILGVIVLGETTAVGGGIIRDLFLGITPPSFFNNHIFFVISLIVSILVFLPSVLKLINKNAKLYNIIWLIFDTIGLAMFTVAGVKIAHNVSGENILFIIFCGVITGVGGGIIRDVLAGHIPYIFVKHFYACASIVGATICAVLMLYVDIYLAMILGAVSIIVLRILAIRFRWSLPKPKLQ